MDKAKRIVLVGQIGTGKSSFVKKLCTKEFFYGYKATIGTDEKRLTFNNTELELLEIAGQELFGNMTGHYYKGAAAVLVFVDITRCTTFNEALKWKKDLFNKNINCPIYIVYNKCDIEDPINPMIVDPTVIYDNYKFKTMFKISCTNYEHCYNVVNHVIKDIKNTTPLPISINSNTPITTPITTPIETSKNTSQFIESLLDIMDGENFKLNYLKLCFNYKNRNLLDDNLHKLIKLINESISCDNFKDMILNHLTNYL